MPTTTFYLDADRTEAVMASWKWFYNDFRLTYQGQEVGRLTPAELRAGRTFALPDGRELHVKLQQQFGAQGLDFRLDGRPLGGSINDPLTQVKTGFWALLLIAGLNVAVGLITIIGRVQALQELGVGWGSLAEAVIYAGLGWLGRYRLAAWAFYAALGLLVLDGLVAVSSNPGIAGLFVRVLVGIAIFRAAAATRQRRAGGPAAS